MKSEEKEIIGNGAHWEVTRITTTKHGSTTSVIHKKTLNKQSTDKNIINYELIFSNNLPTLSKYSKKWSNGKEIILAEDLNPKNCDGFYVSPNTVRNAPSCATIILKYLNNPQQDIPIECNKFVVSEYLNNPEKITHDLSRLNEIIFLKGAEKHIYENKIKTISNFKQFLIQSKADMKKASYNQIELFSDAFFFRVSEKNNRIDYKIADFDCINSHQNYPMNTKELIKDNKCYFETALQEFIDFFVEKNERTIYKTEIKNVW